MTYNVQLLELADERWTLAFPLVAVVTNYDGEFVARLPEMNLEGTGSPEVAALEELKWRLIDLREDADRREVAEVGEPLRSWYRAACRAVVARG